MTTIDSLLSAGSSVLRSFVALLRPGGVEVGRQAFQLRFIAGASLLAALVGVGSLVTAVALGQRLSAVLIGLFLAALAAELVALRLGGPLEPIVWVILTTIAGFLVCMSLVTRELDPSQPPWLLLVPLAARVLDVPHPEDTAPRSTSLVVFATAIASGAAGLFIIAAHEYGLTFGQAYTPDPPIAQGANFLFLMLSAFGLVSLHDTATRATAAELQHLRTLLSVCGWCRKIKEGGAWITLEEYMVEKTRSELTHGICPTCREKVDAVVDG